MRFPLHLRLIAPIDCTYPSGYGPYYKSHPLGHLANLGTIPNPLEMKNKTSLLKRLQRRIELSYELADKIVDLILEMDAEQLVLHLNELKSNNRNIKTERI